MFFFFFFIYVDTVIFVSVDSTFKSHGVERSSNWILADRTPSTFCIPGTLPQFLAFSQNVKLLSSGCVLNVIGY